MNIQPGKHQVLVRHFQPMATFSFVAMATSVWEFGIFSMNQGLIDGGRAGLIWGTVIHAIGFIPIILSMAEMASIAPTSGSQFHWVSEFSHPRWQKFLSYYTGWISTMAWQAGNAVGVFLTGTLIQTIILENNKDYAFPSWHGSLLVMSNIVFTVAANILLTRYIPKVQTAFFVLHILAFFAVLVPICVSAPKASAAEVFTGCANTGGWSSTGFAVLAGQLSAIYMMCGTDSVGTTSSSSLTLPLNLFTGIKRSRRSSQRC
jgi:amino acid transporter